MTRRTVSALACCTVLTGCGVGGDGLGHDLRAAVTAAEQSGAVLDLAGVVDGDWDRLSFVCPYESAELVTERPSFEWDDFPDNSETEVLYVFSTPDEVTTRTQLNRNDGDACPADGPLTFDRPDARFTVVRDGESAGGDPWLELRPAV